MPKKPSQLKAPFLKSVRLDAGLGNGYPFTIPVLMNGIDLKFTFPITIISGENGTGKSTLLELIATHCGFNIGGGNKNHVFGQFDNPLSDVCRLAKFSWLPKVTTGFFMRAESFFNFASFVDELAREFGPAALNPYGGKSLHEQSHGEAFLALMSQRIGGRGIYLLDEPEAALSPMRQLSLLSILYELVKTGSAQLIIATHSPILMSFPQAQFLYIVDGALQPLDYKATAHFRTMKDFLAEPGKYYRHLFD